MLKKKKKQIEEKTVNHCRFRASSDFLVSVGIFFPFKEPENSQAARFGRKNRPVNWLRREWKGQEIKG